MIVILMLLTLISFSQTTIEQSYKSFFTKNQARYQAIAIEIRKLPIDACKNSQVVVKINIDTNGYSNDIVLVQGTNSEVWNNMIIKTIKDFKGHWSPMTHNGKKHSINQEFTFPLLNISKNKSISKGYEYQKSTVSEGASVSKVVTHSISYDLNENCENSEYYYQKGIEAFQSEKYKQAKYQFINALKSNPYDLECQYKLGMSYLKLDKEEKACECFKKAAKNGDEKSIKQVEISCLK